MSTALLSLTLMTELTSRLLPLSRNHDAKQRCILHISFRTSLLAAVSNPHLHTRRASLESLRPSLYTLATIEQRTTHRGGSSSTTLSIGLSRAEAAGRA